MVSVAASMLKLLRAKALVEIRRRRRRKRRRGRGRIKIQRTIVECCGTAFTLITDCWLGAFKVQGSSSCVSHFVF